MSVAIMTMTAKSFDRQASVTSALGHKQEVAIILLNNGDNIEIFEDDFQGRSTPNGARRELGTQLNVRPCPCPDCFARRLGGPCPIVDYGYRPMQGRGEAASSDPDGEHQLRFVPIIEGAAEAAYVRPMDKGSRFRRFQHLCKVPLPDQTARRRPTAGRRSDRMRGSVWRPKGVGCSTASKIAMILMTTCLSAIVLSACLYIVISASVFADQI